MSFWTFAVDTGLLLLSNFYKIKIKKIRTKLVKLPKDFFDK